MDDFDYVLPEAAIAQVPAEPRDAARLLVAPAPPGRPSHHVVAELPDLLEPGDLLVVNTTRVIPARLRLRRESGGAAEVLLLEPDGPEPDGGARWRALVRPSRRIRDGETLVSDAAAKVLTVRGSAGDAGERYVEIVGDDPDAVLARYGAVPFPPYVTNTAIDPDRYQTVFAADPGSVAAPTAGLHLTKPLLDACRARGIGVATVDLTVGLATFRPVTAERPEEHAIHEERYRVPAATLQACRDARRVVAVGTTTVRALESAARGALEGRTDLFIYGDFDFAVVDVLLTNFHLPRSSLLLLVDAFAGPRWRELYALALQEGYRFLSFGDAMLVERRTR